MTLVLVCVNVVLVVAGKSERMNYFYGCVCRQPNGRRKESVMKQVNVKTTKGTKICILKHKVGLVIYGILLLLSIFNLPKESNAKSKQNDFDYADVCEEAVKTIQPLNVDKLDVCIKDIYNVVDTEGNLDGYSLGYFVGEEPYGYAIYSIDSSDIRAFVFYPGVENLYKELEEKAKECDEVDETELINGIVYEGGLDYATFDEEGNRVGYLSEDSEEYDDQFDEVEYDVDVVLNSEPVAQSNTDAGNSTFYYEAKSNIYQLLQPGSNEYYCIPDFGLAMISYPYINKNSPERGYTCDVVSATGCLNYLGYLYNDSIIDTYNMIFDKCITDRSKWGTNPGTNVHEALQEYLSIHNSNIKLNAEWNPSFDKFKMAFTSVNKEATPVRILADNHSVLGLSCYEVNNSRYVGIWKNWYFVDGDPNKNNPDFSGRHTDYSLMNVMYFNYDDRTSWKDKNLWCDFFDNAQSRNIKGLNTAYISGNQMVISCYVPYGTTSVAFPTWTDSNGQDDLIWHSGTIKYGTVAECTIDLNTHNKESGNYITHVYACDKNGNYAKVVGITNYVNTKINNVRIKKDKMKGYTVTCDLPTGTTSVKFPTWSDVNGQDDLIWYDGTVDNNGKGSITIDIANHNNVGGRYITHIYAYDKYNNFIACVATSVLLSTRTEIYNAKLTNSTSGVIRCSFYVPVGTDYVFLTVTASQAGRYGIRTYRLPVTSASGYISKNIYKSDHYNAAGHYSFGIEARNSNNRSLGDIAYLYTDMK